MQKKTSQSLYWNANDAIFDQYKWDQEPAWSLDELYAKRAQEIRERYVYLVLHFNGSSDSGNILETFIRNRIHLDEIVTRGSPSVTTPKTGVITSGKKDLQQVITEDLIRFRPIAANVIRP